MKKKPRSLKTWMAYAHQQTYNELIHSRYWTYIGAILALNPIGSGLYPEAVG